MVFPEDIAKTAAATWRLGSGECKKAIANAILAERQRCAQVVKSAKSNTGVYVNKNYVAEAIMRGEV